jgi:hypothetical protein
MADHDGNGVAMRTTLAEVINALMSGNPNERKLAEQQLDALQVTEGKRKYFISIIL